MRIAIPQHQDVVSGAYELSQKISIHTLDFQQMSVEEGGLHDFPAVAESFEWLLAKGVQAVLVGTIDPDNAERLAEKGIHVFTGAGEMSPAETVGHFMSLMRAAVERQAQGGGCCGGHGESGGCCGGEEDEAECANGDECCGGKGHGEAEGEAHECCGRHQH